MQAYRLVVHRNGKLLGHFDSDVAWSHEAVRDIAARLDPAHGYRLQFLRATEERRILESTAQGVRVLSRSPVFTPVDPKP